MTILTTVDSKKRQRPKPAPKSEEQRAREKADAAKKKVKLKAGITAATEAINKIIEDLADEHEVTFEYASTMVHLGGRVFKDRRRPSIQNAYWFCLACVEDRRCERTPFPS
jgi:ribosomal protein L7Ae-like RNA K-turn-binding protein